MRLPPSLGQQLGLNGWGQDSPTSGEALLVGGCRLAKLAGSGSPAHPYPGEPLLLAWGDSRRKVKARPGGLRTLVLRDHA